ncbi:MAG: hypothetical protein CMO12_00110 [Thaumarchaeota archaeon]|jgi:5S rRNA maturation endonuclease (ribonuclease M5)|nr:hypothetical protein [Nitrososphaerota archaeon]|tara:strand:- start:1369 stop:1812 length:444 start_codon:yes stop_codon:yes gene_type:complete
MFLEVCYDLISKLVLKIPDNEVLSNLTLFVNRLNDEAKEGALVVVEGRRDASALRGLGFHGPLYLLCHNGSPLRLTTVASRFKKTILLTDLDSAGRALTKRTALLLNARKRKFDLSFRKQLNIVTKGSVNQVEDLKRYQEFLAAYVW